jgi:hypothetical protein
MYGFWAAKNVTFAFANGNGLRKSQFRIAQMAGLGCGNYVVPKKGTADSF